MKLLALLITETSQAVDTLQILYTLNFCWSTGVAIALKPIKNDILLAQEYLWMFELRLNNGWAVLVYCEINQ